MSNVKELVRQIKDRHLKPGKLDHARITGSLDALITVIMIQLEVCHPEAYKDVENEILKSSHIWIE